MTGNREAHPLLISLANLDMEFRMKASNNAFLLLALLPIPKFIHTKKRLRGVLSDRVYHECMDFVTKRLKVAAQIGIMMSDPLGGQRYCYTPIAAFIVDTPESALIAGVGGKTSSVTMAFYKQFGDNFRHEPRTASTTIAQLKSIEDNGIDPWDLPKYFKASQNHRLNGVHRPFWRDWPLSDPADFLTPEPLHHWHKLFWDHDAKWCIQAVGAAEIDFRFSVLHPHTGFRHFKEGISALKQVTGREHRNIQRYIISVIADSVPKDFLIAVRALMDFRYFAQAYEIDDSHCQKIENALQEFHRHKDCIIAIGARCGEKNNIIDNWHIPKLEFLQSVVTSIKLSGVCIQWSADRTENAHISEVKEPGKSGNNQAYENQICRTLDRTDKCHIFNLATAIQDAAFDFRSFFQDNMNKDNNLDDDNDEDDLIQDLGINKNLPPVNFTNSSKLVESIDPVSTLKGTIRNTVDYFSQADLLKKNPTMVPFLPARTFLTPHGTVAIHLQQAPQLKKMTIDEAAAMYNLPDLRPSIADFIQKLQVTSHISTIGGRRIAKENCYLPFSNIQIWTKVRLQTKSYHYPYDLLPPQTVNASPPSQSWPFGQRDVVLVNTSTDTSHKWPKSGLKGEFLNST